MFRTLSYLAVFFSIVTTSEIKVGLLYRKGDPYESAWKNIVRFAEDNFNITVISENYGETLLEKVDACCKLVSDGVSAVVSASTSLDTAVHADVVSPLNIPLVAVSATDPYLKTSDRDFLLRLSPPDNYQGHAIHDLLERFQWKEISILASSDSYGMNGIVELQNMINKHQGHTVKHTLFFELSKGGPNVSFQLQELKASLAKVILLHCGAEYVRDILREAMEVGLMGVGHVWIITEASVSQPASLMYNGSFVSYYEGLIGLRAAVTKSDSYNRFKDSYLLSSNVTSASDLTIYTLILYDAFGLASQVLKSVGSPQQSGLECSSKKGWHQGREVLDAFLSVEYSGVVGKINFTRAGISRRVVYDIVNFKDDNFQTVGTWHNSSHINMFGKLIFLGDTHEVPSYIANDLEGVHLKLGALAEGPFMYEITDNCEGNSCWTGMCDELIQLLQEDLGFTYEYVKPPDGHWGGYNPITKRWNGLINELIERQIDMVPLPLSTSVARKEVIDFGYPFMDAAITAIVKAESGTNNPWFFLSPFDKTVFAALLMVNFIVAMLIGMMSKISPMGIHGARLHAMKLCNCRMCDLWRSETGANILRTRSNSTGCLVDKVEDKSAQETSLYNSIWMVGTGLVGKNTRLLPYSMSGRFLLFSWWFFMLIIMSVYTANLTAFMTLSNLGVQIDDVQNLLGQTKYEWGVIGNRNPETLLLTNKNKVYTQIAEKGVALSSLEEALERLRNGSFVFIDEGPILRHHLKDDCDMFTIGNEFQSFEYSFGLPKGSPYKNLVDKYLLQYREKGVIDYLWSKWSAQKAPCDKKVGNDVVLDMKMLGGAFYILGAGVCLSLLIVTGEILYSSTADYMRYPGVTFSRALKSRLDLRREYLLPQASKIGGTISRIGMNIGSVRNSLVLS